MSPISLYIIVRIRRKGDSGTYRKGVLPLPGEEIDVQKSDGILVVQNFGASISIDAIDELTWSRMQGCMEHFLYLSNQSQEILAFTSV
jgi:hypothetical protein